MQTEPFPIQRERLIKYSEITWLILGLYVLGLIFLAIGWRKTIRDWVKSLEYRLDGDYLSVYSCVSFWGFVMSCKEQRIPLTKINDVKLVQGPILNLMNLWNLYIQTASIGTAAPEAVLWGLESPQQVRNEILAAMKKARGA